MSNEKPPATKYSIVIDGPQISALVSIDDIRAYMTRKGFTCDLRHEVEVWTLLSTDEHAEPIQPVGVIRGFDDDRRELRILVTAIARNLDRPRDEVLREIGGEVVTIEDGWAALLTASKAASVMLEGWPEAPPYGEALSLSLSSITKVVRLARSCAAEPAASHNAAKMTVLAHAGEDLAALILEQLRRERAAPAGPTS